MAEEYDSIIVKKEEELENLKPQLESLRLQLLKKIAEFIANWYEETAKTYVSEESANTLKIGKERISLMKAKVQDLKGKVEEIVNEFLSQPSIWWHLSPKEQDSVISPYEPFNQFRLPEILDKPVRRALGKLGVILEEFGYRVNTKPTYKGMLAESNWYEYSLDSKYLSKNPIPYYPYNVTYSNEMQDALKNYNELHKQAYRVYSEIKNLQRKKRDKQATDLWDSA